jgi:ribosomal protein S14
MKKLIERDKNLRLKIKTNEKQSYILKSIFKNFNFFTLVRWNAYYKLRDLNKASSYVSLSYRCLASINKKRFNKLTVFSRHIFLKLIRSGNISGFQKSTW